MRAGLFTPATPKTASGTIDLNGKGKAEAGVKITKAVVAAELEARGQTVLRDKHGEVKADLQLTVLVQRLITLNGGSSIIQRRAGEDGQKRPVMWKDGWGPDFYPASAISNDASPQGPDMAVAAANDQVSMTMTSSQSSDIEPEPHKRKKTDRSIVPGPTKGRSLRRHIENEASGALGRSSQRKFLLKYLWLLRLVVVAGKKVNYAALARGRN